ncbi:MAG TPA: ISKra4 family transposase, partial [Gemmatimonadetes bacterium]|nr:ISKra4 family transposase [Gemmatimonadota bacterium]
MRYVARDTTSLQPLDAELNLPKEVYSHGVRKRVAEEASKDSYEETVDSVAKTTGAAVGKRQVEELAIRASSDFEAFYQTREVQRENEEEPTGEVLAISVDGKGIVMRKQDLREQTRKKAERQSHKLSKRLSKGEKRNAKRMATVATVYSIQPFVRQPEDIVAELRPAEQPVKRPRPENKRVWASVERPPEAVITEAFEEALRRDPEHNKQWVALVDGNETQLRLLKECTVRFGVVLTIVLDLIHVLGYLWKAAFVFHKEGSEEAQDWVTERLLRLLQGQSSRVAAGIRRSATRLQAVSRTARPCGQVRQLPAQV